MQLYNSVGANFRRIFLVACTLGEQKFVTAENHRFRS
jgi:hypothetical protein